MLDSQTEHFRCFSGRNEQHIHDIELFSLVFAIFYYTLSHVKFNVYVLYIYIVMMLYVYCYDVICIVL